MFLALFTFLFAEFLFLGLIGVGLWQAIIFLGKHPDARSSIVTNVLEPLVRVLQK